MLVSFLGLGLKLLQCNQMDKQMEMKGKVPCMGVLCGCMGIFAPIKENQMENEIQATMYRMSSIYDLTFPAP